MASADSQVLILGCGYVGREVGRIERQQQREVTGVARQPASGDAMHKLGIAPLLEDLDGRLALPEAEAVYYFAPPPGEGRDDPRIHNVLGQLRRVPKRLVLISTTGVYGDAGGQWVSEDAPLQPGTARGQRRLAQEHALGDWCERHQVEWVILRVVGIYGPHKLPLARLRRGEPVLEEAQAPYSNRVHIDDLAAACHAAQWQSPPNRVFNISDGHPSTMTDYFNQLADVFGMPRPPQVSRQQASDVLSPGMLSFLSESKRISNQRMVDELTGALRYPHLRDGLIACRDRMQADTAS